jgi:20S proteasome subunit alpha 6
MKQKALGSKIAYGRAIPIERIVGMIGDRAQTNTQQYGKRPYGVGLLVAGVDELGPHLFEFQPSGMTQEMLACAIGARSQMARTYLERHLDEFADCDRDELLKHGLRALRESLAQDKELTVDNTTIGVVGVASSEEAAKTDQKRKKKKQQLEKFKLYDGQEIAPLLEASVDLPGGQGDGEGDEEAGADAMETDS